MAHNRKHRRDNAVSAAETREVPAYFQPDPEGESAMLDDYLIQRAEDDATAGQYKEDYLAWAADNREMLSKFMMAMTGQNPETGGNYRNKRNDIVEDMQQQERNGSLDFKGTWAIPTKEQISKSESKAADRENYRKQQGNRDSQGTLMTAAQQEAEQDRIYNEYAKTMATDTEEARAFNEYGQTMGTYSPDWGLSDWSGWFSGLVGEPSGKKPPRNSPRGK